MGLDTGWGSELSLAPSAADFVYFWGMTRNAAGDVYAIGSHYFKTVVNGAYWRSTDSANIGLWRTTDGGDTWAEVVDRNVFDAGGLHQPVGRAIVADGDRLYVGTMHYQQGAVLWEIEISTEPKTLR